MSVLMLAVIVPAGAGAALVVMVLVLTVIVPAGADAVLVMMVLMLMIMPMMLMPAVTMLVIIFPGCREAVELGTQAVLLLHGAAQSFAVQLVPGGGDDDSVCVFLAQERDTGGKLFLAHARGAGQYYCSGVFDLVAPEFAEVFHVHFGSGCVHNGGEAAGDELGIADALHGADDVGQLAHARWLDKYAVRIKLGLDLLERLGKIADETAADAARAHLGDLNSGVSQKAAVNGNLSEFVFNKYKLLAGIRLGNQLFDQCCLAGSQKTGENVYFSHNIRFLIHENTDIILTPKHVLVNHFAKETNTTMKKLSLLIAILLLLSACGGPAPVPTPTSTPAPTPEPTPTPDPVLTYAGELLAGMTEREKLCQLMIVRPQQLGEEAPVTESGQGTQEALEKWGVGGIIYSVDNLVSREQTAQMIKNAQSWSKLGLFISADEEGGNVGRLMYKLGTSWIDDMYSYREEGANTAYNNANTIARDMLSCHFNTDFAPVADVWTNPENTVIGDRAYSDDYEQAAELVAAAVKGFKDAGLVSCVKHFPGHGDTQEDSHEGGAVVSKTLAELRRGELLPFISGMEAGVDMVMMGHMTVPEIDDMPASLSHELTTGLLREDLGWQGVVVTDSLDMGALSAWTQGERCVMALAAGCDILLGVTDIEDALLALEAAVLDGSLTTERIDESVLRVLMLKIERGIIEM